jgi:uncharacterized membrane protein
LTTPVLILAILVVPFAAVRLIAWRRPVIDPDIGGVIGLIAAFIFFGMGHFVQTEPMAEMLPPWAPRRIAVTYATGILEWVLAAGLWNAGTRRLSGWACIVVLAAFFPANIYAAIHSVGMGGHQWGPAYLLVRAPVQVVLIGWAYWFAVREVRHEDAN